MSKSQILCFLIILLFNFVEASRYFPRAAPPPHSMHFSPLLRASAVRLSRLLSPCCVHPLFLPTTPTCMFAIYPSPPPAACTPCLSPSPSTCIHPASCSASAGHVSLFSATPTGIHAHPPLSARFPPCPLHFFSAPLRISLIPAYLYPFLPAIFLIFWFLLSPYLRHPSLGLPFVPFLSNSL